MSELLHQLGIDWRLFLSQAVNFLILLGVLRYFAYGPLVTLLKDRRARIEEGLVKADEADRRLHEVDEVMKLKMREAEQEALKMMHEVETKAKAKEAEMLEAAKKKEEAMIHEGELIIEAKAEETKKKIEAEAVHLVKAAIAKTVEMKPEAIDEALVGRAIASMKQS